MTLATTGKKTLAIDKRPILPEQALVRDPQRHLDPGLPHLLPRHA